MLVKFRRGTVILTCQLNIFKMLYAEVTVTQIYTINVFVIYAILDPKNK